MGIICSRFRLQRIKVRVSLSEVRVEYEVSIIRRYEWFLPDVGLNPYILYLAEALTQGCIICSLGWSLGQLVVDMEEP